MIEPKPGSSKERGEVIALDPRRKERQLEARELEAVARDEKSRQEAIARRGSQSPTDHDITQLQAAFVRAGQQEAAQIIQGLALALFGADKTLLSKLAIAVNKLVTPRQTSATFDRAMKAAREEDAIAIAEGEPAGAVAIVEEAQRRARKGGAPVSPKERLYTSLCEGPPRLETDGVEKVVRNTLRTIWVAWSGKYIATEADVLRASRKKKDHASVIRECFRACKVPGAQSLGHRKVVAAGRRQRAKRKK